MTTERAYFYGKTATISFKQDGGTAIDVGYLQNIEIRAVPETVDLEGCGSVLRQSAATKKWRVTLRGTVKAIDFELLADILSPTRANWTSGTGILTGIENTDTPSYFDVVGVCKDEAGKSLTVTAKNVIFEDIPIMVGTYGEWMEWEMSGTGDDITVTETP